MLIGIKYCGGCNPTFDRGGTVQKIIKAYPGHRFENVREDRVYDLVLVLQGCSSMCANLSNIRSVQGFINIRSSDLDQVEEVLGEGQS